MGIFNWGLTDKQKAINKIQADYRAKNNGQPMDDDQAIQIYMNSLNKDGNFSPTKVKKNVADFSKLSKLKTPMSNFDYGQDGLPGQLEAVRAQNEMDASIESQINGNAEAAQASKFLTSRQGFGNVVRPLDERLTVGPEPMQRGLSAGDNQSLGFYSQEEGYDRALDTQRKFVQNDNMNEYLGSEGGAYGTADNELSASVPTPAQSAFAGQSMDQMDGDFGGMGEEPEPARTITPEYIAEVSAKGGSFMADGTVSYPDAPVVSDRMQRILADRSKEAKIAESNRLAAIEFDKTKMGVDSTAAYPKGTVIGGVMGTDENALIDENGVISPVPSTVVSPKKQGYRTRQQRIDDAKNYSASTPAAVSKSKPKVNSKTDKNTVKINKNPYGQTPYVPKSKVARDVSNIINTTRTSPVIPPAAIPLDRRTPEGQKFISTGQQKLDAMNIMNADKNLDGYGYEW